jgi:hypothetical protein
LHGQLFCNCSLVRLLLISGAEIRMGECDEWNKKAELAFAPLAAPSAVKFIFMLLDEFFFTVFVFYSLCSGKVCERRNSSYANFPQKTEAMSRPQEMLKERSQTPLIIKMKTA